MTVFVMHVCKEVMAVCEYREFTKGQLNHINSSLTMEGVEKSRLSRICGKLKFQ